MIPLLFLVVIITIISILGCKIIKTFLFMYFFLSFLDNCYVYFYLTGACEVLST